MRLVIPLALIFLGIPALAQGVDLSSPKSAAKSLYEAMLRGDAAALRQVIYVEKPEQAPLVAVVADLLVAGKQLGDACKERFGESAGKLGMGTIIPDDLAQIEQAEIKEKDGIASIVILNQLAPLRFKKDPQGWKLLIDDYMAVHEANPGQVSLLTELAEGLREVAQETSAGRYPTAMDVETAILQQFNEAMIKASKGTTQTTTQPATQPSMQPSMQPSTQPSTQPQ